MNSRNSRGKLSSKYSFTQISQNSETWTLDRKGSSAQEQRLKHKIHLLLLLLCIILKKMGKRNLKECSSSQLLSPPWISFPLKSYPGHSLQSPFLNFLTGFLSLNRAATGDLKLKDSVLGVQGCKICPSGIRIIWTEGTEKKKTALPSDYLKAGHQFVKVFPFPSLPGRIAVNHWDKDNVRLYQPRDGIREIKKPFYKWLLLAHIFAFPHLLPQKLEVFFLCLVSSLNAYCLLRIYISLSFYHPFELLIA